MTRRPGRPATVSATARTDATGTMWRLRSLAAIGHGSARIARALGVPPARVRRVVRGQARTISCEFQAGVCQLWDAWWDKTPPRRIPAGRRAAAQALRQAKSNDWPAAAGLDETCSRDPATGLVPVPACTGTGTAPDFPPARPPTRHKEIPHEHQRRPPGRPCQFRAGRPPAAAPAPPAARHMETEPGPGREHQPA
jgi:hypothetical protein